MRHILKIGSRQIASGTQGQAIQSVKLTQRVNRGEEFCFGSVCPGLLEISLLELESPIAPGDKLELLDENRKLLGTFYCQTSEVSGIVTTVTAYDSLYFLEKDVTGYIGSLRKWPYTLEDFAHLVCSYCGVSLADGDIPNGGYAIEKFTGSTTGRALMSFAAEAAGCYLQADETGVVHFRWYQAKDIGQPVCLEKKLQDFVTAPVEKIHIRANSQDVGVFYPDTAGENAYRISGNPLLVKDTLPIAQSLYEKLQNLSYTPGQLRFADSCPVAAGDIISFQDKTFYVMQAVRGGGTVEVSCFGQEKLSSVPARNQEKFTALSGKVLELQAQVDGLSVENRDAAGNLARLSLDVEQISSKVVAQSGETARLSQSISQISQKADSISWQIQQVSQAGANRLETAFGMTLDGSCLTIARQGSDITNRLNETGMYVVRDEGLTGETVMLQADAAGVVATDVTVRNYLKMGEHARVEDYQTNRTACFYYD